MAKKKQVAEYEQDWKSNPFRQPKIEKIVVNICVGQGGEELNKAKRILELLTKSKSVTVQAKKNVKEWGIRKGQSIAVKSTLRGDKAHQFLKRVLFIYDNRILRTAFDNFGNFSIGVDEHIKLPDTKYIPELGITGFDVSVRLTRPGYRVKIRRKQRSKIPRHHYVNRYEAMEFMKQLFKVEVVDVMEERFY
ncbi:MAG: 50S ribosomal protein L5 [Candidatus Lokiarchaeota archaeon]|nr:50S ribosomal protein L5 [Candidatus Lokiarchaeota archaeon]